LENSGALDTNNRFLKLNNYHCNNENNFGVDQDGNIVGK
jgi:hypothetical protein